MSPIELKSTLSLAAIFALRMLGLFMILPVFSLYGDEFTASSALLVGLAIGAYGLGQALFQLPFGLLSDRLGRKPLIVAGLILFLLGGLVATYADSIYGVILGRALQGCGAIAAVIMALLADLTQEQNRSKAMAMIGMSIGLSFSFAILLGPILSDWVGIRGLFMSTSLLALLAIIVCMVWVPEPKRQQTHRDALPDAGQIGKIIRHRELLRMDVGIFVLHLIVTASFVVLPLVLRDVAHLEGSQHWKVYLPIMALSFVIMVPLMIVAEKKQQVKQVFLLSIVLLSVALAGLAEWHPHQMGLYLGLFIFFFAFNLLEALMPSLVSKIAPAGSKGTALGIYSSCQFSGAFIGGALGGLVYGYWGIDGVYWMLAVSGLLWLVFAWGMAQPRGLQSYMVCLRESSEPIEGLVKKLLDLEGVEEALLIEKDQTIYLKVDKSCFDEHGVREISLASPLGKA